MMDGAGSVGKDGALLPALLCHHQPVPGGLRRLPWVCGARMGNPVVGFPG